MQEGFLFGTNCQHGDGDWRPFCESLLDRPLIHVGFFVEERGDKNEW